MSKTLENKKKNKYFSKNSTNIDKNRIKNGENREN